MSLMTSLGGKPAVREKLLASLQQEKSERASFFRENLWCLTPLKTGKLAISPETT